MEFAAIQDKLKSQCKEVESEIELAAKRADHRERQLQRIERSYMKRFRREQHDWTMEKREFLLSK